MESDIKEPGWEHEWIAYNHIEICAWCGVWKDNPTKSQAPCKSTVKITTKGGELKLVKREMTKHELYEFTINMWRENRYEDKESYIEWLERKLYTANEFRNQLLDEMHNGKNV